MALATTDTSSGTNWGSLLSAVPGLVGLFTGSTSTTTGGISQDSMNAMLTQLLSGTNGLASVAGGQNTAGLYNSTVQQQSINDLTTRAAAQVAAANSSKTTTTAAPVSSTAATALTALGLGAKLLSSGSTVSGLKDKLSDFLGLNSPDQASPLATLSGPTAIDTSGLTTGVPQATGISPTDLQQAFASDAGSALSTGVDTSGTVADTTGNLAAQTITPSSDVGSVLSSLSTNGTTAANAATGGIGLASDAASAEDAGNAISDAASATIDTSNAAGEGISVLGDLSSYMPILGAGVDVATGQTDAAIGTAAGAAIGSIIPVIGTGIGAAVGGFIGSNAPKIGNAIGDVAGDIGSVAGDIGNGIGDIGSAIGNACFITTAVCKDAGLPDDCEDLQILRAFRDSYMSEFADRKKLVEQYYNEAPRIVSVISSFDSVSQSYYWKSFRAYIKLAIYYIKSNKPGMAFETYKNLFNYASGVANGY